MRALHNSVKLGVGDVLHMRYLRRWLNKKRNEKEKRKTALD